MNTKQRLIKKTKTAEYLHNELSLSDQPYIDALHLEINAQRNLNFVKESLIRKLQGDLKELKCELNNKKNLLNIIIEGQR